MPRNILLLVNLTLFSFFAHAQNINKYIDSQSTISIEKLYLHTDREFYFIEDTLWFSAYLVEGSTHKPLAGDCNLFVELVDDDGILAKQELFSIVNGHGPGYLGFTGENIKEGNFLLRAYTDKLRQFGEEVFFTKTIKLGTTKNTAGFDEAKPENKVEKVFVDFFPEGGFLLNEKMNLMAIKAVDQNGEGANVGGKILDSSGKIVANFATSYKGMCRIYFIPNSKETYSIEIEGIENIDYKFPETRQNGAKLMLAWSGASGVNINILTQDKNRSGHYYIALFYRGEGSHYLKINGVQTSKTIKITNEFLHHGINRLVLLNDNYEPISERLIFCDFDKTLPLKINLNSNSFGTRQKVELKIEEPNKLKENEFIRFSVAVVNNNALNASGSAQNIKSYLLTDSELKGKILAPADYFIDDEGMPSKGKLNLLMLTNGWKNYLWNSIKANETAIENKTQLGISIKGNVTKTLSNKAIGNTEITYILLKNSAGFISTSQSNINGEFELNNIQFVDSALIAIQAKNHRDKTRGDVQITALGNTSPPVTSYAHSLMKNFNDIPVSMHRMNYFNELTLKEFYPDKDSKLLDEINIVGAKKKEDDGHFRLYSDANHSKTITESDYTFANVFDYLRGRFPGVTVMYDNVKGDEVIIRGRSSLLGNNGALFLIDGMMVDQSVAKTIPMFDIDKVEVLKGANAAILGMRGANGAISILTKKGGTSDYYPRPIPGTIVSRIKGFASYCEFYSPKFTEANIDSKVPDFRTTLYWNPVIELTGGSSTISFFTCDNLSSYKIIVEGISSDGTIRLGKAEFQVNRRDEVN